MKKIYEIILENKKQNKHEISELINKSVSTVQRIISRLTSMNLIVRNGSNKTGYWSKV